MPDRWMRNAVAEAIGAFALVFVGVLVVTSSNGGLTSIALAHGLTIAVAVAALAHVSGGHFNPAVTLAMYLSKSIDLRGALTYWAAQLIGGLAAALVVLLATDRSVVAMGAPALGEGIGAGWAIVLEAIATFVLVLVVYGTVVDSRAPYSAYPFAIGFAVTVGIFAIGPMTGAALNPARAFGPALVGGEWGATAAWLIGPLLGAVLAWAVYEYVISPRAEDVPSVEPAEDASVQEAVPSDAHLTVVTERVPAARQPSGAASSEVVSNGTASNGTASNGTTSSGTTSNRTVSNGTVSNGTVSTGPASNRTASTEPSKTVADAASEAVPTASAAASKPASATSSEPSADVGAESGADPQTISVAARRARASSAKKTAGAKAGSTTGSEDAGESASDDQESAAKAARPR